MKLFFFRHVQGIQRIWSFELSVVEVKVRGMPPKAGARLVCDKFAPFLFLASCRAVPSNANVGARVPCTVHICIRLLR